MLKRCNDNDFLLVLIQLTETHMKNIQMLELDDVRLVVRVDRTSHYSLAIVITYYLKDE